MNTSQQTVATTSGARADVPPVQKTITVTASPEKAFRIVTEEMSAWWPLARYHIGKADAQSVVMERLVGGRWYERGVDGSESDWGRVRAWDPPRRVIVSWEITSDWRHDRSIQTEVDVRFSTEGPSTRVELEHRLLHHYGEKAAEMRGILDSPQGWTRLLDAFASRAAGS